MIKVINICTSNTGGAGNAVDRINNVLNQFSDSWVISLAGKSKNKSIVLPGFYFFRLKIYRYLKHTFYKKINKVFKNKYNFYNYGETNNYINPSRLLKHFPFQPDILIVHFTAHFINFKTIYEIQKITGCSILFNIVDTSFMTGGCHWSWDCNGYKFSCSNCPAIKSKKIKDLSNRNFLEKKFFINKMKFSVNVSSSFAFKQVQKSFLLKGKKPSFIYYPIDQKFFKPSKKINKTNRKNIFFGTQDLNNPSKGVIYFVKAIEYLCKIIDYDQKKLIKINIAGKKIVLPFNKEIEINYLGTLPIDKLIKEYSNSDIFVCSSIEDNGPMMINESLMCGTPVVAFDTGISSDLINNETGYLAKNMSHTDLAEGIKELLFNFNKKTFRHSTRGFAINNYGNKKIRNEWENLIKTLNK